MIKKKLNPRKAPGHNSVTARKLPELTKKGDVFLTYIFNSILRLGHIPKQFKTAKIKMLPKTDESVGKVASYRPISLLPILSKLFEKLFVVRLLPILEKHHIIPDHQFGFREKRSTIEKIYRVVSTIRHALKSKQFWGPTVFIDIKQAFHKVWQGGLMHKVSQYFPAQVVNILKSYLTNRKFHVNHGLSQSSLKPTG